MTSEADIRTILEETRVIAMVGASAKPVRPSFGVLEFLLTRGYRVYPINPGHAGRTILGVECLADLAAVPEPIDMVDVFRASDALPGLVDEMLRLDVRPKVLWTQLGVRDDTAAARSREAGIAVVMDRCPKIEYARLRLA